RPRHRRTPCRRWLARPRRRAPRGPPRRARRGDRLRGARRGRHLRHLRRSARRARPGAVRAGPQCRRARRWRCPRRRDRRGGGPREVAADVRHQHPRRGGRHPRAAARPARGRPRRPAVRHLRRRARGLPGWLRLQRREGRRAHARRCPPPRAQRREDPRHRDRPRHGQDRGVLPGAPRRLGEGRRRLRRGREPADRRGLRGRHLLRPERPAPREPRPGHRAPPRPGRRAPRSPPPGSLMVHGGPGGGGFGGGRGGALRDDPGLSPGQKPDVRRVLALFRPYRGTLAVVLSLIVIGAAAGVVSPFLIRETVDVALPDKRPDVLGAAVAGLIAVTIVSSARGVTQAMLSTRVGQSVMHDLRVSVFSHLQRMGLGFFTRTRTGEVQSRIFSDIGSMQAVVTSVMTQIVSAGAGVAMALVAMFAMDWRLTLFSLVALPFAVWMNRRVGRRRRSIVKIRQEKAADLSAGIQESLSVSGILLGVTMGRTEALSRAFATDSRELADLEVRSEMAGRWHMAVFTTLMALFPALTYLLGGYLLFGDTEGTGVTIGTLVAFIALQSSLFPQINGLLRVATQVNSSLALFTRVFEYLDAPILIQEAPDALSLDAAEVRGEMRFEHAEVTYPGAEEPALRDLDLVIPAGQHTALVGATGSGKTSAGYLMARLYEPTAGRVTLDG